MLALLLAVLLALSMSRSRKLLAEGDHLRGLESTNVGRAKALEQELSRAREDTRVSEDARDAALTSLDEEMKRAKEERESDARNALKERSELEARLRGEMAKLEDAAVRDRREHESQLGRERDRASMFQAQLSECGRALQAEKDNTERAKYRPILVPFFRTNKPLLGSMQYFFGVRNAGPGPARRVQVGGTFSDGQASWPTHASPYNPVLEPGHADEYPLDASHFARAPKGLEVVATCLDLYDKPYEESIHYGFS
ncbi:MAG: hypothetical protein KGJ23_12565 [Euryarchaeota archaeon]|nr:hypothetical protein [Euryarchaeota archaeon]MDE1837431.1 hypothetical protein [Euryarchaeota archaeon]MDE1881956.1 hypothetical protein [Euryarchaeota archaeon]MDE2045603.1 hypothetical protein [Thermoplasmata archaeon]